MRDLTIFDSPAEHVDWMCGLLGPLAELPHWRRVATLMVAERAPLGYVATTGDEARNLSMWFGLLDVRAGTYPPDQAIVGHLYVAHELAHLLADTPHSADRNAFAEAFHVSERFASYETELAVYGDVPCLATVVPFRPLLASWFLDAGVDLHDAETLMAWRDHVIEHPETFTELPGEAARLSSYRDTRGWARRFWDRLDRLGWWADPVPGPATTVFEPATVRARLAELDLHVDRCRWESEVCANVVRAHRFCGLPAPEVGSLASARDAAGALDGLPLATDETAERSTSCLVL